MSVIFQNIILGISLAAPIGPANIAIIKKGLNAGFISGFILGIGVVTADIFYLLLIYFGLSRILNIPIIQSVTWIFGSIILLYLGYQSIKENFRRIDLEDQRSVEKNSFIDGFLINISNPMTIVWWIGVFGSALTESLNKSVDKFSALLHSMAIIVGLLAWVFTVALLTNWGKKFLNEKSMGYISLIAGAFLVAFGLKFGYNGLISIFDL
ncbi:MAG: LysE family transporter [bacterium]|nr:LysE family transporter [bacterium]